MRYGSGANRGGGGSERSAGRESRLVHSTYATWQPAAIHLATTPPELISASSGWANTTIARSGTSLTTGSRGSRGMARILQEGGSTLSPWVTQALQAEETTTMADVLTVVAKVRAAKGKADALAGLLRERA